MFDLFPAFAHVTLLAACAEAPLMRIAAAVTSVAVHCQRCACLAGRRWLTMATDTGQRPVRAVKPELGAGVMVKIPQLPGARIVATFATLPERQLVLVFLQVARRTVAPRIPITQRLVAILASGQAMTPAQRKACPVVIKTINLPVLIAVTGAALGTNLALVFVVLLVASHTLHRRVAVTLEILVTGLAFGLRPLVCVLQAKA